MKELYDLLESISGKINAFVKAGREAPEPKPTPAYHERWVRRSIAPSFKGEIILSRKDAAVHFLNLNADVAIRLEAGLAEEELALPTGDNQPGIAVSMTVTLRQANRGGKAKFQNTVWAGPEPVWSVGEGKVDVVTCIKEPNVDSWRCSAQVGFPR